MLMNILTIVLCAGILWIFLQYWKPLKKLKGFVKQWSQSENVYDIASEYNGMSKINEDYKRTLTISIANSKKVQTIAPASDFYNRDNIARAIGVNIKAINSAPGLVSGLGVLGTFIGLTISVFAFNSTNSETIMSSIQTLLGGMGTAFATSVIGMICSSIYIWQQKKVYNNLSHVIDDKCKELDDKNYVSEVELLRHETRLQQQELLSKFIELQDSNHKQNEDSVNAFNELNKSIGELSQKSEDGNKSIMEALNGYDEDGESISVGQMLVNLHDESTKQSQALENFTTDLSNEFNASLGKTMDKSIVPLIMDLERSHKTLTDKLDLLSSNIQSPATEMVDQAINDLKTSMIQITSEFKDNISTNTIDEMNSLAENLSKTGDMLNNVPAAMKEIIDNISNSFNNVKDIVNELQDSVKAQQQNLLEGTKSANSEMANGMKEKFDAMTSNFQEAASSLSERQNSLNEEMANSMKEKFDAMTSLLEKTVTSLNEQQNSLIEGQGRSTREIERLLNSFDESLTRLKTSNQETTKILVKIQEVGENMDGSADKLNTISGTLKDYNEQLLNQQKDSLQKYSELQAKSQESIEQIQEALEDAKNTITDYAKQYEVIKNGLQEIFTQIDNGVREYSATLRNSTGDALSEYSSALANSTKGLQNIAEALGETAEELTDSVDKLKMRTR